MTRVVASRIISASPSAVFKAIADVENLPRVVPCVVQVEMLSESPPRVGTRFCETRTLGSKQAETELEITEYVPDERIRMVTDTHGTVWDTVFSVRAVDGGTELALSMDAKAHKLLPKLLNPVMKSLFHKGLDKHVAAVKEYCERPATPK